MKKTLFLLLMVMLSFNLKASMTTDTLPKDSIKLAYFDARTLLEYARKGYYLQKIDSINNTYIISLQLENTELRGKKKELEVIVQKDTEIIKLMQKIQNELGIKLSQSAATIAEQKAVIKRLRRDKREAIISGAVVMTFLVLGLVTK